MRMSREWLHLRKRKKVERLDVACLRERKDENREDLETRKSFQEAVRTRLQEPQRIVEKWRRNGK